MPQFSKLPAMDFRKIRIEELPDAPPSRQSVVWVESGDDPDFTYQLLIASTTEEWIEVGAGGSGEGSVRYTIEAFTYATSSPLTLLSLVSQEYINSVTIFIDTAFNGTVTLSVGEAGNTGRLLSTLDNDPATIGSYEAYPGFTYSGTNTISLYLSVTGGSVGAGRVVMESTRIT